MQEKFQQTLDNLSKSEEERAEVNPCCFHLLSISCAWTICFSLDLQTRHLEAGCLQLIPRTLGISVQAVQALKASRKSIQKQTSTAEGESRAPSGAWDNSLESKLPVTIILDAVDNLLDERCAWWSSVTIFESFLGTSDMPAMRIHREKGTECS